MGGVIICGVGRLLAPDSIALVSYILSGYLPTTFLRFQFMGGSGMGGIWVGELVRIVIGNCFQRKRMWVGLLLHVSSWTASFDDGG